MQAPRCIFQSNFYFILAPFKMSTPNNKDVPPSMKGTAASKRRAHLLVLPSASLKARDLTSLPQLNLLVHLAAELHSLMVLQLVSWVLDTGGTHTEICRTQRTSTARRISTPHLLSSAASTAIALFLLYLRAHWMRMPFPMLIRHLAVKGWRRATEEEPVP